MGKFDKEVAAARKIGADWIKEAEGYENEFIGWKKENVQWEKKAIGDLQTAVKDGTGNPRQQLGEVEVARSRLAEFEKILKAKYDKFDKWALKEPRNSMGTIDAKLKLGGSKTEAYEAVKVGIKNQLTDVASAISSVQRTYNSDLMVVIANQQTRLEALEKILNGTASKSKAFLDQLNQTIGTFQADCEKIIGALKIEVFERDLEDLSKGVKKDPIVIAQKHNLVKERLKLLPALDAQVTKNYSRVIKSVPAGVADQFISSGAKKRLEDTYKKTMGGLSAASDTFLKVEKEFKKLEAA